MRRFSLLFCLYCASAIRAEITPFAWEDQLFPDPSKWTVLESPKLANFLERQRFFAERSCPLQSTRHIDLVESLKLVSSGIKSGFCKNSHEELVTGISELLTSMNMTYMMKVRYGVVGFTSPFAYTKHKTPDSFFSPQQQDDITTANDALTFRTQTIMNQLNEVAKDPQCNDDMRRRGLLSTIGNISLSVGQMGLLIPTEAGIGVAAGGMGLGSILKVISALMLSKFDWENENDRRQFQELNCLFFKIRNELDGSHFFSMSMSEIEETIAQAKFHFEELSHEFQQFLNEKDEFESSLRKKERDFVEKRKGQNWLSLLDQLTEFDSVWAKEKDDPLARERFTLTMMKHAKELSETVRALPKDEMYKDDLSQLLQAFVDEKSSFFAALDDETFDRRFKRPLLAYFQDLADAMKNNLQEEKAEFDKVQSLHGEDSNKQYIEQASGNFNSLEKRFRDALTLLAKQIEILKLKQKDTGMGKDNPESGSSYDVLKEYHFISNVIFGHIGWSFIRFLRKDSFRNALLFESNLRKFQKQYPEVLKNMSPPNLSEACRDAKHLKITWDHADASAEVLMDFFDTNRGIIHSQTAKYHLLLHFLPLSASYPRKIHRAMKATDMARSHLKESSSGNVTTIEKIQKKGKNFGMLLLEIQGLKTQKEALDNFLKENECFKEF